MPLLFDKKNNQVVDVADNLVNDALASGNYRFRQGVRVPVIAPDGTEGTVLSDELPELIPSGFKYLTREKGKQIATEQVEQIREETYGDSTGLALAAGALRGATFGLSDAALASVGLSEALYETKKRNETASMVGEIGGSLVSALTPYGLVGGVARGATAVGQAAARAAGLTNAAGTLTRGGRIVSATAGLGVEGAVVGAGQTISDIALQDPSMTGEKALANAGLNVLWGFGLGAGVGLVGRGAFEAADVGIKSSLQALSKSGKIPDKASDFASWLGEKYGKAVNLVRADLAESEIADTLWNRANKALRKMIVEHMADPNKLYRSIADQFNVVKEFSDRIGKTVSKIAAVQKDIIDEEIGMAATKGTKELIGRSLRDAEKSAGIDIINKAKSKTISIADDIEQTFNKLKGELKETPGAYDAKSINELNIIQKSIREAVEQGRTLGEINDIIVGAKNNIKQKLPLFLKGKELQDLQKNNITMYRTVQEILPVWKKLKNASIDKEIFGDMGAAVGKRADDLSLLIRSTDDFDRQFFTTRVDLDGNVIREADLSKIAAFAKNPEATSKEAKRFALEKFQQGVDRVAEQIQPISNQKILDGLSVAKKQLKQAQKEGNQEAIEYLTGKIGRLEGYSKKITEFNKEIEETIQLAKTKKAEFDQALSLAEDKRAAVLWLNRKSPTTGALLYGASVPGAVFGTLGATAELLGLTQSPEFKFVAGGLGTVLGAAAANPRAGLRFLVAAENMASSLDKAARKSAVRFRNISKKAAQERALLPGVITATRQATIRENLKLESDDRSKSNEGAFLQHKKDLEKMASDQVQLYERVYDSIGPEGAEENPELTQAMYETTARGIAFLQTKIPKDPIENPLVPESEYTPSFAELDKYSRYVKAVKNPKQIFRELEAGDIQPETVEALRMVYPKVYDTVVTAVAMELADGKEIPFDARVQMATLLGLPAVKPLTPAYIQTLAQIGQVSQEEQGQPKAPNGSLNRSQLVSIREMDQSGRQQREK